MTHGERSVCSESEVYQRISRSCTVAPPVLPSQSSVTCTSCCEDLCTSISESPSTCRGHGNYHNIFISLFMAYVLQKPALTASPPATVHRALPAHLPKIPAACLRCTCYCTCLRFGLLYLNMCRANSWFDRTMMLVLRLAWKTWHLEVQARTGTDLGEFQ